MCINTTCTEQSLLIQVSDFQRVFIFLWSIPVYSHTTAFKDRYNANIFSITKNWIEAFFYSHFSITLHLKVVFESCRNIVTLFSTDTTHCFFKAKSRGSKTIALTICFRGILVNILWPFNIFFLVLSNPKICRTSVKL